MNQNLAVHTYKSHGKAPRTELDLGHWRQRWRQRRLWLTYGLSRNHAQGTVLQIRIPIPTLNTFPVLFLGAARVGADALQRRIRGSLTHCLASQATKILHQRGRGTCHIGRALGNGVPRGSQTVSQWLWRCWIRQAGLVYGRQGGWTCAQEMLATLTTIHIPQSGQLAGVGWRRSHMMMLLLVRRLRLRLTGDEAQCLGQLSQFTGVGHFTARWWRQRRWQRHGIAGGHMIVPNDTGGQQHKFLARRGYAMICAQFTAATTAAAAAATAATGWTCCRRGRSRCRCCCSGYR